MIFFLAATVVQIHTEITIIYTYNTLPSFTKKRKPKKWSLAAQIQQQPNKYNKPNVSYAKIRFRECIIINQLLI